VQTKYNTELSNKQLIQYFKILVNRVFAIIPMRESNQIYLLKYIEGLIIELTAGEQLILNKGIFIELVFNLEILTELMEFKDIRKQVFNCLDIVEKIIKNLESEVN
jgi:hypothetical protein